MPTPYVIEPANPAQPTDDKAVGYAAAEFRALKQYIQTNIMPVIASYPSGNNAPQIIYAFNNFW
jgi:hypothetical protein